MDGLNMKNYHSVDIFQLSGNVMQQRESRLKPGGTSMWRCRFCHRLHRFAQITFNIAIYLWEVIHNY